MQLYSAKVQLGGSRDNEVVMPEVTVPEIVLLRSIHKGDEHVREIKPLGREAFDMVDGEDGERKKVLRTDKMERNRLKARYDQTGKKLDKVFGIGVPLPQVLEGVDATTDTPARRRAKAPEPEAELAGMT